MPPGRLSPGLHIPWKVVYYVRWLLTRDSRERRGLLRLLWFNYLFWRPAFECRSLRLSEFLRRLFDLLLSRTKNDHMLGGKEQTKHLESITKKEKKKKKLDYPVSKIAVVETLKIFFFWMFCSPGLQWPPCITQSYLWDIFCAMFPNFLSVRLSWTCPWREWPTTDAAEILPVKVFLIINAGPSILAELQAACGRPPHFTHSLPWIILTEHAHTRIHGHNMPVHKHTHMEEAWIQQWTCGCKCAHLPNKI